VTNGDNSKTLFGVMAEALEDYGYTPTDDSAEADTQHLPHP